MSPLSGRAKSRLSDVGQPGEHAHHLCTSAFKLASTATPAPSSCSRSCAPTSPFLMSTSTPTRAPRPLPSRSRRSGAPATGASSSTWCRWEGLPQRMLGRVRRRGRVLRLNAALSPLSGGCGRPPLRLPVHRQQCGSVLHPAGGWGASLLVPLPTTCLAPCTPLAL